MKFLFLILSILVTPGIHAQIVNGSLDHWELIHTIGQPFENPVGWNTNNYTDFTGLASTPVTKEADSSGYHARIESDLLGIDALLPGELSQTISSKDLVKIDFYSKCDSIFQSGRCVVNVRGQHSGDLLYTDSISVKGTEFQLTSINVLSDWIQQNDSLTIQFVAKGNLDNWDNEEDGYSIFLVDNVSSYYITKTQEGTDDRNLKIYPNPSNGIINLMSEQSIADGKIEIISFTGERMLNVHYANMLDLSWLSNGTYVINVTTSRHIMNKILLIEK